MNIIIARLRRMAAEESIVYPKGDNIPKKEIISCFGENGIISDDYQDETTGVLRFKGVIEKELGLNASDTEIKDYIVKHFSDKIKNIVKNDIASRDSLRNMYSVSEEPIDFERPSNYYTVRVYLDISEKAKEKYDAEYGKVFPKFKLQLAEYVYTDSEGKENGKLQGLCGLIPQGSGYEWRYGLYRMDKEIVIDKDGEEHEKETEQFLKFTADADGIKEAITSKGGILSWLKKQHDSYVRDGKRQKGKPLSTDKEQVMETNYESVINALKSVVETINPNTQDVKKIKIREFFSAVNNIMSSYTGLAVVYSFLTNNNKVDQFVRICNRIIEYS